jgi:putative acetyltransferase
MTLRIRDERPADIPTIHALTVAAFATRPYGDGTEGAIIDALRAAGDLAASLVATDGDTILGQVALSPATIGTSPGRWVGLGPIAVRPDRQRQGIGTALMQAALVRLPALGARGCVLVGDPRFYARFGFTSTGSLSYGDTPAHLVQHLTLDGPPPKGPVTFAPALHGA